MSLILRWIRIQYLTYWIFWNICANRISLYFFFFFRSKLIILNGRILVFFWIKYQKLSSINLSMKKCLHFSWKYIVIARISWYKRLTQSFYTCYSMIVRIWIFIWRSKRSLWLLVVGCYGGTILNSMPISKRMLLFSLISLFLPWFIRIYWMRRTVLLSWSLLKKCNKSSKK